MTPLPVIADVMRVAWNWSGGAGLTATNVSHWAAPGKSELELWTAFNSHITVNIFDALSTDATIQEIVIEKLDGTSAALHFGPVAHGIGNGGGEPIAQVCALMKFSTASRGRSKRGRMYLPFVGEADVNSGKLAAAVDTNTTTAWATFLNAMATDGFDLVIASYKTSSAESVINVVCEKVTATQRRRQDRLRP